MSRNRILNRFHVVRSLATGGMGEIFLADDSVTGEQAVLKVLRDDVEVGDAPARFEHEIEVLKALRDPRVPRWLADGLWKGQRVVAVAFVEGMSLTEIMDGLKRPLALATSLFVIVDVLQALHRAHTLTTDDGAPRGLIHGDVSPHNILCDKRGRGHLIDFGVATDTKFPDSTPDVLVGKVAYMAPEQAAGFAPDARVDQFAAGVVFWELVTGRRLFRADSDQATWRNVLACIVPDLTDAARGVPESVSLVVKRMLDPNRTRRYASCGDAAQALLLAAVDVELGADVPATELMKEARREKKPRPASATLVLRST